MLLPKNCFSANQIAAFKWADRHHVLPTAVCTFSLRTCLKRVKDREPTTPRADARRHEKGVTQKEEEGGRGAIRRVTPIQRKSVSATRVIGGARPTCRRDAL